MGNSDEIRELKKRIEDFRSGREKGKKKNRAPHSPLSSAFEIAAGVFAGIFLGLYLDKVFLSSPIFAIICSSLGATAAFRSLVGKRK